jgi:hypothetical protein
MTQMKRNVRGISLWDVVIWLVVIGSVVSIASRVLPAYTNHWTAVSVCEGLLVDPTIDFDDVDAVRTRLVKQLKINNLAEFVDKDRVLINQGPSATEIRLVYEVRGDLFGNVEFVITFDESVTR